VLMTSRRLDREWGRAIDNDNTKSHHQIFRISEDKKHDMHTLHYSVFYALASKRLSFSVADDFIKKMNGKTPMDHSERMEMEKLYFNFMKNIRPGGKKGGFVKDRNSRALTYDITFDPDHNIIAFDMRPTLARMSGYLSCEGAAEIAFAENPDRELRLWHDSITSASTFSNKQKLTFEEVTFQTTKLIRKNARKRVFEENVDCVWRIDALPIADNINQNISIEERIARFSHQYGSVLENKKHITSKEGPKEAVLPTTASRHAIDSFNIVVMAEFMKRNGRNVFKDGVASAVAQYQRHLATWQYLKVA
jgi:hypothetical protein